ncbi:multiple sugar transport system substrate-binding protein [Cryobacterium sp. MP_M5]|uniref:extracellular solute-binding protein n=1 Tax=unclassified Cryobacterium TaxID=2649013 RepID=UPI001A21A068|nr:MULTISPECIES: extracellular solute-binding protein [unclassified Cryobacterium]MBG6060133.1 multiple sugar transport system substrate-binding protein [Cryobacterium sp. MP_M3]MEC5178574.1 multiple sugar transport system substrate-binding protein [Cryobacterium sp. MP_M5]
MKRLLATLAIGAMAATALAGCAQSAADSGHRSIKVAYQKFGTFTQMDAQMKAVKAQYEAANPQVTVDLVSIQASENDYYTKLSLMNRSAATAPDVLYEDTSLIQSDADAGYLAPLDDYASKWGDWSQFPDNAKKAGSGSDGKLYGISMGTDTRALWYNKDLLKRAGVTVPWEPKNWKDIVDAAEKIKAAEPGVIPINIYSGKGLGEASVMQGLEMLLYGTDNTLFDTEANKWITGSKGFIDSLGMIKDVYQGGLAPTPQEALDPNFGTTLTSDLVPNGKVAIFLDGSWQSGTWLASGALSWPEWTTALGQAPMPTQNGQKPGTTSMSGGWTLAMGSKSQNKDDAWNFIQLALNQKNSKAYAIAASQIPVRDDVSKDPEFIASNPTAEFFAGLVAVTHFRPANSNYSQVSNLIQVAMESVMTGQQSPAEAAKAYDAGLKDAVGADLVMPAK